MSLRSRAANTRSLGRSALTRAYRLDLVGAELVRARGPLVLAIAGQGPLVGPVVATGLPRPIHVLGMPAALGGLPRSGVHGGREARALLRQGAAVAVPVEGPAGLALAAFLALDGEAPVQPVVVSGAHGRFEADPPRLRSTVRTVVHPPITLSSTGDACAWPVVRDAAEQVRQRLADAERTVRPGRDGMDAS